ncbi:MAG: glycosyltransferase [Xanthobacteraceae bacterium]
MILIFTGAAAAFLVCVELTEVPHLRHRDVLQRPTLFASEAALQPPSVTQLENPKSPVMHGSPVKAPPALRFAYFDLFDGGSSLSLDKNGSLLDGIFVELLTIDGEMLKKTPDSDKLNGFAQLSREGEVRLRRKLVRKAPSLKIYPIINSGPSTVRTTAKLVNEALRTELVQKISAYLHEVDAPGILIAFSPLPDNYFGYLLKFVTELYQKIQPEGRQVFVRGDMAANKIRRAQLASAADYLVVPTEKSMEGSTHGAGPPTQPEFEAALREYTGSISPKKLIIGIGAYACDDTASGACSATSVPHVWSLLEQAGAPLKFARPNLVNRSRYVDDVGRLHDVRWLDAATMFNQARAALDVRPAGLAVWRLGYEDKGIWSIFARERAPDARALGDLETMQSRYEFDEAILNAEVIAADPEYSNGIRHLTYDDKLGLIVGQKIKKYPLSRSFKVLEVNDKRRLAITFDDGPDPRNTENILNVLAAKGVHATFFLLGRNALHHPNIVKRIYREGHDIGNHTFSHPRLTEVPDWQFSFELNATQRVLEHLLGVHTTLFRPPTAASKLSDNPDHIPVIEQASRMGYLTVLAGAVGWDWVFPSPTANEIHDRVVTNVLRGDGRIILLHDWGERQETLAALPRIIDTLTSAGYRFATIHDLLGVKRSDVLQNVPRRDNGFLEQVTAAHIGVIAYRSFDDLIAILAILVTLLNVARLIFSIGGALRHKAIERTRVDHRYWPSSVAVIVPAFNEGAVICKTIRSILSGSRSDIEVVVVDDGSTDSTFLVVQEAFASDARVRVFTKANGGKASAANFAIQHTNAEVVVAVDADGVLHHDAIELLVRHFSDPEVGAVAGTAVVGNQVNLLTRLQGLEYAIGQYLERRALTVFNANAVVPGCIGAWRRKALLDVGGYAEDTVAEDCDATFTILRAGWKVLYEPAAKARTEAPESLRGFVKQRRRWMFGMLQCVRKHISIFRHGPISASLITIPYVLILGFFISFAIPVLFVALLLQLGAATGSALSAAYIGDGGNLPLSLALWVGFSGIDLLATAAILRLAGIDCVWKRLPLILMQRIIYLPLIYWVAYETTLSALKGRIIGWNKLRRTGGVTLSPAE